METCANCDASLASEWKFCIRCGTRVHRGAAAQIPGAIRPSTAQPPRGRRLSALAIAGIAAGGVLALAAIVVLLIVIVDNAG